MPIFWPYTAGSTNPLTHRTAVDAESAARRTKGATDDLAERLDRLALVTEALWSLLKTRSDVTDAELLEHIRAVDLSDGVLDGRARSAVQTCPGCERVLSKRHTRCLYCGVEVVQRPFDGV